MFSKITPNIHNHPISSDENIFHPAMGKSLDRRTHLDRLNTIHEALLGHEAVFQQTVDLLQQSMAKKRSDFLQSYRPPPTARSSEGIVPPEDGIAPQDVTTSKGVIAQTGIDEPQIKPAVSQNLPAPAQTASTQHPPESTPISTAAEKTLLEPAPRKTLLGRILPRGIFDIRPLFPPR